MSTFLSWLYPGDAVAGWALGLLLQVAAVVILAVLAARALARRGAAARHGLWAGALACVLLSPAVSLLAVRAGLVLVAVPLSWPEPTARAEINGPWVEPASVPGLAKAPAPAKGSRSAETPKEQSVGSTPTASASGTAPAPAATPEEVPTQAAASAPSVPPRGGLRDAVLGGLFAVWAAGALVLLLRLLHGCCVLAALKRSARPLDARRYADVLDQVRAALGAEVLPPIETSPCVAGPVAGGLFRPRVLLPQGLAATLSGPALRDVLIHECAHLVRRDHLVGLAQRLGEALFWPHPLVHYLNRRLARAREEICDNYVLRHGDPCGYARTLLALATRSSGRGPFATAALSDGHWKLEDRVAGLLDPRRNLMTRMNPWTFAGVAALLLAAGVATAAVRLGGEPATQEKTAQEQPAADPAKDAARARIEGVVVDEAGKPVAGVTVGVVKVRPSAGPTARTAADGSFRLVFDGPSLRYQTVLATADGGARQGIVRYQDTVLPNLMKVRLVLKPSRALTVRVTDARKAPVAGAGVGVLDHESAGVIASSETGADGLTSLRLPRDAQVYQVVALKPGAGLDYYENYRSYPGTVIGTLPAQIALTLDGAQDVSVRAVDSAGKPLPDIDFIPWTIHKKGRLASVNLSGASTLKYASVRTDRQGVAAFSWIPRTLQAGVTFMETTRGYHVPESPYFDSAQPDRPLVARALRNVPISGKILRPDGKPAAGILLQVEGRGNTTSYFRDVTRTGADGSYRLEVYPNQSYLIAVTDEKWAAPSRQGLTVREGQPQQGLDFRLGKGTLIRGRFTVGENRKPAAGQTLTLIEQGSPIGREVAWAQREELVRWATTEKDGFYAIRVGPGKYKIGGLESSERWEVITVNAEETIERDFHLDRLQRGLFTGEVVARAVDGKPVAGAIVRGQLMGRLSHAKQEALADGRGRFQIDRWRDKMWLYARNPEGTLAAIVTIGADDDTVKMVLTEAGQFKGRLVDKNGKAVSGVRILCGLRIGPKDDPLARVDLYTETDEGGRFILPGMVLGARCTVTAFANEVGETLRELPVDRAATVDLGDLVVDRAGQ